MDIILKIFYICVGAVVGSFVLYLAARLIFSAWFKTKEEFSGKGEEENCENLVKINNHK